MADIIYSDYYLPKNTIHVSEFLKCSKFKQAQDEDFCECFISQSRLEKIGVETDMQPVEIFDGLLEQFFTTSELGPEDITHFIYTSPDHWTQGEIYIPYYLAAHFGMVNASISGMVQECVTTLQAMQTAAVMVDSGMAKNVLILSICYGWNMGDRYTGSTVVGDGAGILVVGKQGGVGQISGGSSVSDGRFSLYKYKKLPPKISGLEIARKGAEFILGLLKTNGLTLDDIRTIVPQNINYSEYHMYSQYLGIDMQRIYLENISNGGHLAEVDSIRNLTDIRRASAVSPGDKLLLYGSGTIGAGMDAVYNGVLLTLN